MQTCNLKSMKQSKITNLLIVVFLIFSVLIPTINLSAREVEKKRGYKGTISKEKILSTFIKDECIVGHVIKGDDIIEIIKATDHAIRISDSIIEGGLNFTKLPAGSWEKVKLPKGWNTQAKQAFIKRKFHPENVHIVKNRIDITNSEIRSDRVDRFSINATATLFFKQNSYRNVVFSGLADFSEATFSGKACFRGATFSGLADFSWTTFSSEADFQGATFSKADFRKATFSSLAYFLGATFSSFSSLACFSRATFSGEAYFLETTFSGLADFSRATFIRKADFLEATFSKADFRKATFSSLAYFRHTSFTDALDLRHSKFKEYLDFRNATIRRLNFNSHISPTILRGRVDFRKSIISEAHFQDIIFENDVDFSDVQFGIPIGTEKDKRLAIIFRFITFQSDAYFIGTNFCGDTAFERVTFKKDSNFTDAIFKGKKSEGKGKLSLSHLNFKNLLIRWNQFPNVDSWVNQTKERIKSFIDVEKNKGEKNKGQKKVKSEDRERLEPLESLSAVLKRLEASFRDHNQLSDANNAYYHKKLAELNEAGRNEGDLWSRCQKRLAWFFWGIPCGYGTKVSWILAWCVFFDLLFAIIFSVKGHLKRQSHPPTKKEFTFKQRLFDFPTHYLTQTSPLKIGKFINALRFSSVLLFKIGYRDTTISGKLLRIDYKYIVWIEWALGFYLLACLVVTLSNTLPIVNRLITGMF
jgi:uncharacterized protein YjbI with pentapeptide repeats